MYVIYQMTKWDLWDWSDFDWVIANFKVRGGIITKANAIHKEKDFFQAVVANIWCIVLHITELYFSGRALYNWLYHDTTLKIIPVILLEEDNRIECILPILRQK